MATTTTQLGTQKIFGFVLPAGANEELVKQTVVAIFTGLFLLTVFVLFVAPHFSDLVVAQNKVNKLEESTNNLTKTLDALDSFKQNVNEAARESVFLAIPVTFDPGYILLSIRKLASDNKVSLITYNLAGGEVSGNESATPGKGIAPALRPHLVSLQISGSPTNLINFVDSLDRYLPVATVSDLSVSEVSRIFISGVNEAKLTMNLTFYHMPLAPVSSDSLAGKFLTDQDLASIRTLSTYQRLGLLTQMTATPSGVGKQELF